MAWGPSSAPTPAALTGPAPQPFWKTATMTPKDVAIIVVLIAMLGSVTVLPALLSVLGDVG
jgi:uncharacterized membrane protein YdfJ with MMPL/SSD domain